MAALRASIQRPIQVHLKILDKFGCTSANQASLFAFVLHKFWINFGAIALFLFGESAVLAFGGRKNVPAKCGRKNENT